METNAPPADAQAPASRDLPLLAGIFLVALALRLVVIAQVSAAPFFDDPFGDPLLYYQRALGILRGDWLGTEVFFHSSPPYPFFIALALRVSGRSLFFVHAAQAVVSAANCVLIALLAKRLGGGRAGAALAGFGAALYATLAFFDADLLMISLTLFFADLALLLLIACRERDRALLGLGAGVAFGLAALDKTNLLTFAPLAALFLASGLALRPPAWRLRPAALFLAGVVVVILPVTARNWAVGRDLVLVSSNGGVNFFIGNNPAADGTFSTPPGSGLQDAFLGPSSLAAAERALGRKLRPSEASRYWGGRALAFFREQPGAALRLLGRKVLLLVNRYEIPNHMNVAFIATEFAPVLGWMPVGFGLVAPLALAGILLLWRRGLPPAGRLLVAFILCYVATLVAFFITERYRLPIVPPLIAFAAVAARDLFGLARSRAWRALALPVAGLLAAGALVFLPLPRFRYTLDRIALASRWYEKAMAHPERRRELLEKAIVEYRWALEVEPGVAYGHVDLGLAYDALGFHSGSAREYARAVELDPTYRVAGLRSRAEPDTVTAGELPRTPFEEARATAEAGRTEDAVRRYRELLRRDPFHWQALVDLCDIALSRGRLAEAGRSCAEAYAIYPEDSIRQRLDEIRRRRG
jgi:tetratricopeptide (TPR) repeat protein